MSKNVSITIVVLAIVAAFIGIVVWNMQSSYVTPPANPPTTTVPVSEVVPADSSASIDQSLNGINVEDLEKEFGDIDSDLKSL